jgi:hypothetical protein
MGEQGFHHGLLYILSPKRRKNGCLADVDKAGTHSWKSNIPNGNALRTDGIEPLFLKRKGHDVHLLRILENPPAEAGGFSERREEIS